LDRSGDVGLSRPTCSFSTLKRLHDGRGNRRVTHMRSSSIKTIWQRENCTLLLRSCCLPTCYPQHARPHCATGWAQSHLVCHSSLLSEELLKKLHDLPSALVKYVKWARARLEMVVHNETPCSTPFQGDVYWAMASKIQQEHMTTPFRRWRCCVSRCHVAQSLPTSHSGRLVARRERHFDPSTLILWSALIHWERSAWWLPFAWKVYRDVSRTNGLGQ
jgi:hypothetical protein